MFAARNNETRRTRLCAREEIGAKRQPQALRERTRDHVCLIVAALAPAVGVKRNRDDYITAPRGGVAFGEACVQFGETSGEPVAQARHLLVFEKHDRGSERLVVGGPIACADEGECLCATETAERRSRVRARGQRWRRLACRRRLRNRRLDDPTRRLRASATRAKRTAEFDERCKARTANRDAAGVEQRRVAYPARRCEEHGGERVEGGLEHQGSALT